MPARRRRERERTERHRLIVEAARDLAETEGWNAVTTRRLADRVEYSQPVLYSHFASKEAIVAAVAVAGFDEFTTVLRTARAAQPDAPAALRAMAEAYLRFAADRPALYSAMFLRDIDVEFATEASPEPLRAAFGQLLDVVTPLAHAHGDDPETAAEVLWAGLHGIATLTRGSRLRTARHDARLELLIGRFVLASRAEAGG